MTIPKSIAERLILAGKASTLAQEYSEGRTWQLIQRSDVNRIDRVFIGYGDRRRPQ